MIKSLSVPLLILLLASLTSLSQTPFSITNQRAYSGNDYDIPVKHLKVGLNRKWHLGYTTSSEALDHQSINNGGSDIWIIEEENNSINWEKSIGGLEEDVLKDGIVDKDGNVVLLSFSNSFMGGDKSENSRGSFDYWIVKINPDGDIIWDKTIGGDGSDSPSSIIELESSYLIVGHSTSSISGDKTEAPLGGFDIWMVEVDFSGSILNQNVIGTSQSDQVEEAIKFNDNEILISSMSFGGIEGDKTVPHYGIGDCWLIRYNLNNRTISNQVSLGGIESEEFFTLKIVDNQVYVAIQSYSDISGNKSINSYGEQDIWVVKLNNQLQILEQNSYGGNDNDYPIQICYNSLVSSNIFILGGSRSISGTGLKNTPKFGDIDIYWVEVDKQTLDQVSDTVFGGAFSDSPAHVLNTAEGFSLLAETTSGISGNKTVPFLSVRDFWLLNLEFEPNAIAEMGDEKEFQVFPNPTSKQFQLKGISKATRYALYDAHSRTVLHGYYSPNDVLSVEDLAAGIYFLKLDGYSKVEKLIIN